ncbi:hypothetical protein ACOSQ4_020345 [Xanthoceras sorbifolium]
MAEVAVSHVVERLGDFLIEGAVFFGGVRNELMWLNNELSRMQSFLKDADEKQDEDVRISNWVSEVNQLACDIEDVLDTFRDRLKVQRNRGCFHSVCCCIFHKGVYNMHEKLAQFIDRIKELSGRGVQYGLQYFDGMREQPSRSTSFFASEEVIGFEDEFQTLLARLLDPDPRRLVISICGMGGLGKTTLAAKLYNDPHVTRSFNCRGWVSVSQSYTTRDLLLRMIISLGFDSIRTEYLDRMNETLLAQHLYKSLQEQSYFLVIDDIWDKEVWKSLERAFPDKNGGRVIITTRLREIAERSAERITAHALRFLSQEESWELFRVQTFRNFYAPYEVLGMLGKEIVGKCHGLPLAIKALGGLLSRKKPEEWKVVRHQLQQHLSFGSIDLRSILTLSFDSLPHQLKLCFLYLSCFPEDFEIKIEKLIHLLVAEGFIPQVEDHTMEEVAEQYLHELIDRNLIQVGQRYWGRILTCRVHNIIHDLAIEKASTNFLGTYDEVNHSNISSIISSCPRQAIYSSIESCSWLQESNPRLRSLFLYGEYEFVVPMWERFGSLRILVNSYIGNNDYVTRKLIHLKYLGLKDSFIFLLPSIVFNLPRLQTLEVPRSVFPVDLPAEISKSQELRHLIGNFNCVPRSIQCLTNLQTLRSITNKAWTEIKTRELVNLRELWLGGPLIGQTFSFDSMNNLTSLQLLSIELGHQGDSFGSLQPLSHCQRLVDLRLKGKMENLPEDMHEVLPNLQCLSLRSSLLEGDPMPQLEKLPNLMILHLGYKFYSGKKMMCRAIGFLRLEILLFDEYKFQIEELLVEERAFPNLKGLRIPEKFKLTIPERLRSLPTPDPNEYSTKSPDGADLHSNER